MSEILTPLSSANTLQIPGDPAALIGWVVGFIAIIAISLLLRDQRLRMDRVSLVWLAVLSILVLVLTPFVGIVPRMAPPVSSGEVPFLHLMFFAAIPWMVASGVLGLLPAVLLAGVSGLWLAYLDTQNLFTPLILMSVAVFFSWSVRQNYRTKVYQWLRFPIIAALISLLVTTPIVFLVLVLSASGTTANRVAHAFLQLPVMLFTLGGMVLIGSAVCVIVQAFVQARWGGNQALSPAPGEVHFFYRFLAYALPILLIASAALLISTWNSAQNNARRVLLRQMTSSTSLAAESLSVFIETGKSQLSGLASDPQVISGSPDTVNAILQQNNRMLLFFNQMALVDTDGNRIAGYPELAILAPNTSGDWGAQLTSLSAEPPVAVHMYAAEHGHEPMHIAFLTAVSRESGESERFLWGQTTFDGNWLAQPFVQAMDDLALQGGYGQVVEPGGEVLFNTAGAPAHDLGSNFSTGTFFQTTSDDGHVLAHYYQPVAGVSWGVVSSLPKAAINELAWQTTYPIWLIATGGIGLVMLLIWVLISPVATEMDVIATVIYDATEDDFDPERLDQTSKNRSSPMRKALHNMLIHQKNRMNQQAELLSLGGRLAGQLSANDSLNMILASALVHGATSARVVLTDSAVSAFSEDTNRRYGVGQHTRMLAVLDQKLLDLARREGFLFLNGVEIEEKLPGAKMMPNLAALFLVPLRWKDLGLGVLWVAFSERPLKCYALTTYLQELGRLASASIVNTKTYAESSSTLAMMESIFNILPDAVLVADQDGQVLFHNHNAEGLLKLGGNSKEAKALSSLLSPIDFAQLRWREPTKPEGREIRFEDDRAFILVSKQIRINQQKDGYLMLFKDLTQQKMSDAIKSEFVTTVSHELRSPLTLILGYAKILRLTGNLNDQQDAYISNIIDGVEEMKDLVQKLLDIGHLEGWRPP
jgi:PAS domain-containing protein